MRKRSIRSLGPEDLSGHRVLVRVDYNVPLEASGAVGDATRIEASLPTLRYLLESGARPVLVSHLGRPGARPDPGASLEPIASLAGELLGSAVRFFPATDTDEAVAATRSLPVGEVLLLENTRFLPGETANDEDLGRRLALLGDLYVNDAFGATHRAHASVVGAPRHISPAVAGFLVERELEALNQVREAEKRPFVVAFGGAKIMDKIPLMESFLERADRILIGGAMANTFLAARGFGTGASLVEEDAVGIAADFLRRAPDRLVLPTDLVVGAEGREDAIVDSEGIQEGMAAYDIGPSTREAFAATISTAGTFFWNGPMGWFEAPAYAQGTVELARAAVECTEAGGFAVVGGGDSARAIVEAGLEDRVSHVSTGGGASLEYLAHGTLPGLEVLDDA
jgi:3-phosphoglycerate kinase